MSRLTRFRSAVILCFLFISACDTSNQNTDAEATAEKLRAYSLAALEVLFDEGQWEEATTAIEGRGKLGLASIGEYRLLADVHLSRGNPVSAEAALDEARSMGATPRFLALQTAKIHMLSRRFESALSTLRLVPLEGEEGFESLMLLAQIAVAQDDVARARQYYDLANEVSNGDSRVDAALSFFELVLGNVEEAQRQALQALEKSAGGEDPLPYFVLGSIARLQGNAGSAIAHLENALTAEPNHVLARLEMIGAYVDTGEPERAQEMLDVVLQSDPNNEIARFYVAYLLNEEGQFAQANDILVRLGSTLKTYLPAKRLYGHVAFELGSHALAQEYLEQYLTSVPWDVETRMVLSEAYRQTNDPEKALVALQGQAPLQGNQASIAADAQTGALEFAQGNFAQAKESYELAIEKANDYSVEDKGVLASLYAGNASSEFALGNRENAVKLLTKAVELDPGQKQYLSTLANMQMDMADLKGALETLSLLKTSHPDEPVAHNLEGAIEYRLGNYGRAVRALTRALELNTDYPSALKNRAAAYIQQGELELAKSDLLKVLPEAEGDSEFFGMLGSIYLTQDDFTAAVEYYGIAYELVPDSSIFAANYALALGGEERYADAIEAARAALELVPEENKPMSDRLESMIKDYSAALARR